MKIKTKKLILSLSMCTLLIVPTVAYAGTISSKGTSASGVITRYVYAWTGSNDSWAETTINLYSASNNVYLGQLSYAYDGNGWAQTPQKTFNALSSWIKTTYAVEGLSITQ